MAATRIATVEFSTNKNCYVTLPVSWRKEFSKQQDVTFEIQWGDDGKAYLSWAGEYIRHAGLTSPDPDAAIQLNGLFANKLGLRHGQEVLLTPVSGILPCSRVFVQPASTDDWEILELNANYIESNLLNQVRVVWKNQILPIWIDKKVCIFIKIGASEPHASCIRLEPSTELVVAPKTRLEPNNSSQRLTPSVPSHINHSLYSESTQTVPCDSKLSSASSKESGFSVTPLFGNMDQMPSSTTSDKSYASRESGFVTAATTPAPAPLDIESLSLDGAIPWTYRMWSTIKWLLFQYGDTKFGEIQNTDTEEDARRKLAAEFWKDIQIIARVQPMVDKRNDDHGVRTSSAESLKSASPHARPSTLPLRSKVSNHSSPISHLSVSSSSTNSYTHLMQPTTVYLSSNSDAFFQSPISNASKQRDGSPSNDFLVFLAHLKKLTSPRERKEEMNSKLAEAQRKTQEGTSLNSVQTQQKPGDASKTVKQETTPLTSCVVRCIIHTKELKGHRVRQPNNIYSSTTFDDSTIKWWLQVPDLLRRQMGLECTAKVQLKPVTVAPHAIQSITLHPLFEMPKDITEDGAVKAFSHWLSCVSCMISPIPICRFGTLVKFPISRSGELMGEFLISVNHNLADDNSSEPYYLLHPLVVRNAMVTIGEMITQTNKPREISKLPYWSDVDLDEIIEGFRLKELGGVGELGKQAIHHINTALMTRPLSNQMCQSLPGISQGGLLICGASGSGKTSLARAICKEISAWPSLAYATVVECKPLRGRVAHSGSGNTSLARAICKEISAWPSLAYATVVECKPLRGKRVDYIRRVLEEAFNEASWRQPSVILLDDLDQVTRAPLGPEDEVGPEAAFHTHVAQVIRDVLTTEIKEHTKLCVIATARSKGSLHQSLTSSRGSHFFQSFLEIQPLNKEQRIEVFTSVIQSKVDVQLQTIDILDLDHIAGRTEGFVARDIVTIVDRAIHAGCSRELIQGKRPSTAPPALKGSDHPYDEILLTNEDFEIALNQFIPSSLRDVPLHSAGELGWQDVGGLKEVKQSLVETLQLPAKYPDLFASCPLRLRSGLLLYGPPGTGKTLLGGVVAKECGLNFISIKGPELLSKYIGQSEQGVRDLFGRAQSAKPCILFFDEFDSLAPRRGHDSTGVTDRVVNQLLTQLDGVEGLDGVYVIGATSRPDLIDPALLRPGRLDKSLFCPIPTAEDRVDIITALSRNLPISENVDLRDIAMQCDYFTGADLKALLYNAQLEAIHEAHNIRMSKITDADETLGALDPTHCRSMDADDWKLVFMESFASESELSQLLNNSALSEPQTLDNGNEANNNPTTPVANLNTKEPETGNTSDSSLGSIDSLRLNLQELTFNTGQGAQVNPGQSSNVQTPSYVMTPEERKRSIEQVLRTGFKDRRPSMKDLAEWKLLYEHGRRSPRPLPSVSSIENEEVPGPPEDSPSKSSNQSLIYMPTLRDGVMDPSKELQERLCSQISTVKGNYEAQSRGLQANLGVRKQDQKSHISITQSHLSKAASSMKPSVSATERARYQYLYDSFIQSRGGDFTPTQQTTEKRATLA